MKDNQKVLVSACLAGEECRYDCQAKPNQKIIQLVQDGKAISVCPEQMGGLPTPRPPAEIQNNKKVITNNNQDVTQEYNRGAQLALEQAKEFSVSKAYLKSKSPMCGYGKVYDGQFSGKLVEGNGVFTALLIKLGIEIESID
jgi:uncharacterized protein YbbK (DUF523 family)